MLLQQICFFSGYFDGNLTMKIAREKKCDEKMFHLNLDGSIYVIKFGRVFTKLLMNMHTEKFAKCRRIPKVGNDGKRMEYWKEHH